MRPRGLDTALYTRVPARESCGRSAREGVVAFNVATQIRSSTRLEPISISRHQASATLLTTMPRGGDRKCSADEMMLTSILRTKRRNYAILQRRFSEEGRVGLVASATSTRISKASSTTLKIELRDGRRMGCSVIEFFRFRRLRIGCWRTSRPQVGPDPRQEGRSSFLIDRNAKDTGKETVATVSSAVTSLRSFLRNSILKRSRMI